jgi:hypothetical protein
VSPHPCQHRSVSEDGRVTCDKIVMGDHEVSPHVCDECPASICNCHFLRFCLEKVVLTPITVRWASGRMEVWDDQSPRVSFLRAACALKTTPVLSPANCQDCPLRQSVVPTTTDQAIVSPVSVALGDNVIPFVRPLHQEPSLPCTSP